MKKRFLTKNLVSPGIKDMISAITTKKDKTQLIKKYEKKLISS